MNKRCNLARAPGGQMQSAATQAMRGHRRGAATQQMPARRSRSFGLRPAGPLALLLAPRQRAWGPAAKCNLYSFTGPNCRHNQNDSQDTGAMMNNPLLIPHQ